jgi:Flp pilus assembly protein TadG
MRQGLNMTQKASPRAEGAVPAGNRRLIFRFIRNRRGSVAIEFGMLILPFSLLIFAILETCISFAGQQVLANAADTVARQLRTGQMRTVTEEDFREEICKRMEVIVSSGCPGLKIDLREYDTFELAAQEDFKIVDRKLVTTLDFDEEARRSMSKNMLRVFYEWPVMIDLMRRYMAGLEGGKALLFASVTWQNEPFDD